MERDALAKKLDEQVTKDLLVAAATVAQTETLGQLLPHAVFHMKILFQPHVFAFGF